MDFARHQLLELGTDFEGSPNFNFFQNLTIGGGWGVPSGGLGRARRPYSPIIKF